MTNDNYYLNMNNGSQNHDDRSPRKGIVEDVSESIRIRDIIKFELSDARVPNKDNPKDLEQLDMDTLGSRFIQVAHPASRTLYV